MDSFEIPGLPFLLIYSFTKIVPLCNPQASMIMSPPPLKIELKAKISFFFSLDYVWLLFLSLFSMQTFSFLLQFGTVFQLLLFFSSF
ncbi:expressed protein [Echinococcus multilocularis]|uniref:Expressed protein n=1 Tax=Echinococcus multilocularis TaxID=6211 RepID=A0A068XVY5_ECHMU|nr:expressed protein [Echinococcus multilocularis]